MAKNSLFRLIVKAALLFSVLLSVAALRLGAQADGAPAGGFWNVYDTQDKMTAAHRVKFELAGNSEQREARGPDARGPYDSYPGPRGPYDTRSPRGPRDSGPEPSQPHVEILCENGNFKGSNFYPGVRMAPPNRPGFWGQPQMEVLVRVNDSHSNHGWNWTPDFLAMDKNTTRELIGAQLVRIEFLSSRGPVIAEFSPTGLDLGRMAKACGLKPKKP